MKQECFLATTESLTFSLAEIAFGFPLYPFLSFHNNKGHLHNLADLV